MVLSSIFRGKIRNYNESVVVFLLLLLCSCSNRVPEGKVNFSGNFPASQGAYVKFQFIKNGKLIDTKVPLRNGKFNFFIDSLSAGECLVTIRYPWPNKNRFYTYRNDSGELVKKKSKVISDILLSKHFYINPLQSRSYVIRSRGNITPNKFSNFTETDYLRSDIFGLTVESEAEDTRVYEEVSRVKEDYNGVVYWHILDSLYKQSDRPDKIYNDFAGKAKNINAQKNYAGHLKKRLTIVEKHTDNPAAILDLLEISKENTRRNIAEFKTIFASISGRAKASPYYQKVKLKIDNAENGLRADTLVVPTGTTPNLDSFQFNLANYKYVLVEFWASWCMPCRVSNPEWNQLQNHYGSKGFQILGVSLDRQLADWQKAIKEDKLGSWLHVSALDGSFSSINALKYGIESIPFNMLVDHDGHIISENIKPEELNHFLETIVSFPKKKTVRE